MTITQGGHVDKLEYGWWDAKQGHVHLPATLGDPRNYVLSPEELAHYDLYLSQFAEQIAKERDRVSYTLRCLRKGKDVEAHTRQTPTCFTLAHVLEMLVEHAKYKLDIMKLLLWTSGKRVDQQRKENV